MWRACFIQTIILMMAIPYSGLAQDKTKTRGLVRVGQSNPPGDIKGSGESKARGIRSTIGAGPLAASIPMCRAILADKREKYQTLESLREIEKVAFQRRSLRLLDTQSTFLRTLERLWLRRDRLLNPLRNHYRRVVQPVLDQAKKNDLENEGKVVAKDMERVLLGDYIKKTEDLIAEFAQELVRELSHRLNENVHVPDLAHSDSSAVRVGFENGSPKIEVFLAAEKSVHLFEIVTHPKLPPVFRGTTQVRNGNETLDEFSSQYSSAGEPVHKQFGVLEFGRLVGRLKPPKPETPKNALQPRLKPRSQKEKTRRPELTEPEKGALPVLAEAREKLLADGSRKLDRVYFHDDPIAGKADDWDPKDAKKEVFRFQWQHELDEAQRDFRQYGLACAKIFEGQGGFALGQLNLPPPVKNRNNGEADKGESDAAKADDDGKAHGEAESDWKEKPAMNASKEAAQTAGSGDKDPPKGKQARR